VRRYVVLLARQRQEPREEHYDDRDHGDDDPRRFRISGAFRHVHILLLKYRRSSKRDAAWLYRVESVTPEGPKLAKMWG
jgi:hypothetical protein